jgi:ribosomal protein L40E
MISDMETGMIDNFDPAELVRNLAEKLRANYIFPEVAEQICVCLQKHLEDGEYADIAEGEFLALALTLHMQEVNHDEHLWVRWHPETLPDDEGQLRLNPQWQEEQRIKARLDNHGVHKVERLPGNVGYIDIHYFHRPEWAGDTVSAGMTFVADSEALIIDLRQCTGGFPATIALFCSYLFGDEPILVSSIYWRDEDRVQEFWTTSQVPGKRFGNKPVYALISKSTFSGGEGFASILQSRKRATLLGDKTDGGANAGASFRLHPHFEVFIPIGRTIDPLTGSNWEGTGITPDISIPQEQAFKAAYHMALKSILASIGESTTGPFKSLAEEAQTAIKELTANQKVCARCGYQNPPHRVKCKNCDEPLPDVKGREETLLEEVV